MHLYSTYSLSFMLVLGQGQIYLCISCVEQGASNNNNVYVYGCDNILHLNDNICFIYKQFKQYKHVQTDYFHILLTYIL